MEKRRERPAQQNTRIGVASMPYAVAAELGLLTGRDSDAKKLFFEEAE